MPKMKDNCEIKFLDKDELNDRQLTLLDAFMGINGQEDLEQVLNLLQGEHLLTIAGVCNHLLIHRWGELLDKVTALKGTH